MVDSPERPDFSLPGAGVAALARDGDENPLPVAGPRFSHEYDFFVPNIRLDNMLLVAIRAVSTDCWCCAASVARASTIFLASFLETLFLSRLGALSATGVDGAEPGVSRDSDLVPPSPKIALALRLARLEARASSLELSFSTSKRHRSDKGFVPDGSVDEWLPGSS